MDTNGQLRNGKNKDFQILLQLPPGLESVPSSVLPAKPSSCLWCVDDPSSAGHFCLP